MAAKAPPSLTNGTLPSPALPGYGAFIPETPGSSGKIPDHCNSGAEEGEPPSVVIESKVCGEWVVQNSYLKSWRETCTLKSVQIVLTQRLTGTQTDPVPHTASGQPFPPKNA